MFSEVTIGVLAKPFGEDFCHPLARGEWNEKGNTDRRH